MKAEKTTMKPIMKSIKIDIETYEFLLKLQSEMKAENGYTKHVTIYQVIQSLYKK